MSSENATSTAAVLEDGSTNAYEFIDCDEVLHSKKRYWFWRRAQDIFFSLLALIVLSPLFVILALVIYIDDPYGSPFVVQELVGRNGEHSQFLKFRTMVVDAEAQLDKLQHLNEKDGPMFKIKNDPRITRVGKFLRKTSLDELPQLFNILRGEMSIVGPRPCLPKEYEKFNAYQRQKVYVQPGLTCYWQIQPHRDQISFDDWIDLDIKYVKERSFLVDWKIIVLTVGAVFRGSGE